MNKKTAVFGLAVIACCLLFSCDLAPKCQVRFSNSFDTRYFAIGTDATSIVLESGPLTDTTTAFFDIEPGTYRAFTSFDDGASWTEPTAARDFAAGKRFEVRDNGGVAFDLIEL